MVKQFGIAVEFIMLALGESVGMGWRRKHSRLCSKYIHADTPLAQLSRHRSLDGSADGNEQIETLWCQCCARFPNLKLRLSMLFVLHARPTCSFAQLVAYQLGSDMVGHLSKWKFILVTAIICQCCFVVGWSPTASATSISGASSWG